MLGGSRVRSRDLLPRSRSRANGQRGLLLIVRGGVCVGIFLMMASPATVPKVTAKVMNAVRAVRPLERVRARQALLRTNM